MVDPDWRWRAYDPRKNIFGHEELNPGHKQPLEGMQWVENFRQRYDAGQWKPGDTAVAAGGPQSGTRAYWEQGRVTGETQVAKAGLTRPQPTPQGGYQAFAPQGKAGETQVAATAPDPQPKPRSEPPAQVADAGPRTGTQAYWRGPKHGQGHEPAQEAHDAIRTAQARRSRGNAAGEADADPTLPYAGSAMSASGEGAQPMATVSYEGGVDGVPERVVISLTVARV